MSEISEWTKHEKLEFHDKEFGNISLPAANDSWLSSNCDFNTELVFNNCKIDSFNATALGLCKPITFKNCEIGSIWCHATYFLAGLHMINCTVKNASSFDCGVHNNEPSQFVIDRCVFQGHLDFFDVYFGGPVQITNNKFKGGTSLALYLNQSFGIKKGIHYVLENNEGQLEKYSKTDPFNPEKSR